MRSSRSVSRRLSIPLPPFPGWAAALEFVIPAGRSAAEGSAVRLSPKQRPLQVRLHILPDGLIVGT